jgi:hypothetical protein
MVAATHRWMSEVRRLLAAAPTGLEPDDDRGATAWLAGRRGDGSGRGVARHGDGADAGRRWTCAACGAGSSGRGRAATGPELDRSTLALWESWPAEMGAPSPAPAVRIVGFIAEGPWREAVSTATMLCGYGASLLVRRTMPARVRLAEADYHGITVVVGGADLRPSVVVRGRSGPVNGAERTVALRYLEESSTRPRSPPACWKGRPAHHYRGPSLSSGSSDEGIAGDGGAAACTVDGGRPGAYLDVPYAEKDQAKALGARWDPTVRRWYGPRSPNTGAAALGGPSGCARAAARRGPYVRLGAVRRPHARLVLVHQRSYLRFPARVGAASPHDPGPRRPRL